MSEGDGKTKKIKLNLTHCSDVEAPERAERNSRACGLEVILDLGMTE